MGDSAVPASDVRAVIPARSVVLGPMAGITEAPFRAICKRMGAALTYTEMLSTKGLHYNPDSLVARSILTLSPDETPCAVQVFGADPVVMAEQSVGVLERLPGDVALIDINMGCPVTKVVRRGEGSALMREPALAAEVVRAVASACDVPVTVKMRTGWDDATADPVGFALAMQEAGAASITVHGRTRERFYKGAADWDAIAAVVAACDVPVVGSGDVLDADAAAAMLERTGAHAVMVARGAQGNPWIFAQARALIETGERPSDPTHEERIAVAREHAAALVEWRGKEAFVRMRKHVGWYVHGLPGATILRTRINEAPDHEALDALLVEYAAYVAGRGPRTARER